MFHLQFSIPKSPEKITIKDSIISVGSCFAENIGGKLKDHKFDVLSNPFGTIYNPISICEILGNQLDEMAHIENQGIWYHWQAHGEVSAQTKDYLTETMGDRRIQLHDKIEQTDWLIVTLGSAFAYRLNSSGRLVANCHKIPQSAFTKELLETEDMKSRISDCLQKIKVSNPKVKTILTVSPVRHIRDGLVENNRSKARLIEVAQALSWELDWVKYFPSYEIQIDELRDYRFFAKDKVHPSEEAIDYIWTRFGETYFDQETSDFIKKWSEIRAALHHRPFHPSSDEHQKFLSVTLAKLNQLTNQVDVSEEVSLLKKHLR